MRNQLFVVDDGVKAMEFLRQQGNMLMFPSGPDSAGPQSAPEERREVLAEVKADPGLKRIPVVVLTVSRDEEDILKVYNLHANCYITKPIDFEQFMKITRTIEEFWLTIVKLPPK